MLKRRYRLTKNATFSYIYRKGQSVANRHLVVIYYKTKYSLKVGFSVSKKIGGAVVRNRVKRLLRESFRCLLPSLNQKHNYIVVAREPIKDADFATISKSLRDALKRCGLLVKND